MDSERGANKKESSNVVRKKSDKNKIGKTLTPPRKIKIKVKREFFELFKW